MLTGVSSHDRRPYDYRDFAFRYTRASQFASQLANNGRFRLVGIDDRVDELKNIRARRRPLHWDDTHALVTHYDLVGFVDIEELDRPRDASFSVHGNGAIHHGRPYFDFLAVKPDKGLLVRRHVKIVRENAIRQR